MISKRIKVGVLGIAAAAVVAAGLLVATQALAVVHGTLGVSSVSLATGGQGTVTVTANVTENPGLGAWTVDVIVANPSQVSIVSCTAPAGSVCNAHYPGANPTVRFAGASATGLFGAQQLGTVTVKCANTSGSSALNLNTVGFADATIGGPVEIAATFSPGMVNCAAVGGIVSTGTGGSDGGSSYTWLIAALAAIGVGGLAGFGAIRVRSARD